MMLNQLKSPVKLYDRPFKGGTTDAVLCVACFGVSVQLLCV